MYTLYQIVKYVNTSSATLQIEVTLSWFGILNLGYWDLFVIWFLVLGIFMIYKVQVKFENS